jgi:endonuclease YncB( thermonuclease family)
MTKPWLLYGLFAYCIHSHAQAVLEKVLDGDTVIIRDEAQSYRLRLLDIDAPELQQSFGKQSKRSLSALCANKPISVTQQGKDLYGRTLGHLYCGNSDASESQITRGMAWFNQRYSQRHALQALQKKAQEQALGLWQQADPVPPWQWRKLNGQHYHHQE